MCVGMGSLKGLLVAGPAFPRYAGMRWPGNEPWAKLADKQPMQVIGVVVTWSRVRTAGGRAGKDGKETPSRTAHGEPLPLPRQRKELAARQAVWPTPSPRGLWMIFALNNPVSNTTDALVVRVVEGMDQRQVLLNGFEQVSEV